uniref:Bcl-2 Bcl-2 homology region 1-3 domain-containing protein n=1 Tax=Hucho hucho TaxID=62062 RepID=A0A4W5PQI2_9TELE
MDQAAVTLRGYVIERFRAEGIQLSPEELGGTPNELQGHELKEMVEQLLETTEELNTNTELQRLISEVSVYCIQDVFFATTKEIFPYGINWGKVAVLHHLPYKLIHRAHTQNQPQVMVNIINDSTVNQRIHLQKCLKTCFHFVIMGYCDVIMGYCDVIMGYCDVIMGYCV